MDQPCHRRAEFRDASALCSCDFAYELSWDTTYQEKRISVHLALLYFEASVCPEWMFRVYAGFHIARQCRAKHIDRATAAEVMLSTRIPEVFGSNLGWYTRYSAWDSSWFSRPLQENSRLTIRLEHDHFLANPFQFITHVSSYRSMTHSLPTDSVAL